MRPRIFFLLAVLVFCPLVPQSIAIEPSREDAGKQVIDDWQAKRPKAFQCSYIHWHYDRNFGSKENDFLLREATGTWQVFSPDRWDVRVEAAKEFNSAKNGLVAMADARDQWMCDGQAFFQFDFREQTLHEYVLPAPKQQSWIFSVTFGILGERSRWITDPRFIRDHATIKVSTPASAQAEIWLEICPNEQRDKTSFEKLDLILDSSDFRTKGVQFHSSEGRRRTVFVFTSLAHPPLVESLFPPATPTGWKRIVE